MKARIELTNGRLTKVHFEQGRPKVSFAGGVGTALLRRTALTAPTPYVIERLGSGWGACRQGLGQEGKGCFQALTHFLQGSRQDGIDFRQSAEGLSVLVIRGLTQPVACRSADLSCLRWIPRVMALRAGLQVVAIPEAWGADGQRLPVGKAHEWALVVIGLLVKPKRAAGHHDLPPLAYRIAYPQRFPAQTGSAFSDKAAP